MNAAAATGTAAPKAGVVQKVRSILREVVDRENAAVERAREAYPRLIEMEDGDASDVAALQEAMRLLGKNAADVTADVAIIQQGRRLQEVIKNGNGLDADRQAAAKAVEDHNAETQRLHQERAAKMRELLGAQNELEGRHSNGQKAYHDLHQLRGKHPEVLARVELIERT